MCRRRAAAFAATSSTRSPTLASWPLLLLFVVPLSWAAEQPLTPLSEAEWRQYLETPPYEQPKFKRYDYTQSTPHLLLERAAQTHQQGDLDKTVQLLKQLLRSEPNHGEAYAALAKVLNDQGKADLAERAMAKATRIHNDALAHWTLF